MIARADALRLPFRDQEFDICIGSPPYLDARSYGIGAQRNLADWVAWMLRVTAEALRVSRGLVVWVCAGVTRGRTYQPGPEALLADWVRAGGSAYRPVYWHRSGIPGSGHDDWFRADVEYCLAFKRPGKLPWADNTANGHAPRFHSGGAASYRRADGTRVGVQNSPRNPGGDRMASVYIEPAVANPGNHLSTGVAGGGRMGSPLAHESEAPYPERLPAWFLRSHCPPAGICLDPFSGSGTTAAAALSEGRRYVACDLRQSQCDLTRRRVATVTPGLPFGAPPAAPSPAPGDRP